jgi:hypothetical protein
MEGIPQGFYDVLISQGLSGVIIAASWALIWVLDRRNAALQESRLDISRESLVALKENTTALNALSSAISQTPRRR